MKKILIFLLVFLIAVMAVGSVLAFLSKDVILKNALEKAAARLTGFKTNIDKLSFNFPSTLLIQGLVIHNPKGFHEDVFANLPEIYIDLDLPELLHGQRIHLREVRLHLQEISIEKNERGVSNISLLSSVRGTKKAESPAEAKKTMPFYLNRLELTVRRVNYADYSSLVPAGMMPKGVVPGRIVPKKVTGVFGKGFGEVGKGVGEVVPIGMPQKKISMDMDIEKQVFTGIKDPKVLVNLILTKIIYGKTFGNLKSLGVDTKELRDTVNLQNTMKDVMGSGKELYQQSTGLVTKNAGSALSGTKNQITGFWGRIKS